MNGNCGILIFNGHSTKSTTPYINIYIYIRKNIKRVKYYSIRYIEKTTPTISSLLTLICISFFFQLYIYIYFSK